MILTSLNLLYLMLGKGFCRIAIYAAIVHIAIIKQAPKITTHPVPSYIFLQRSKKEKDDENMEQDLKRWTTLQKEFFVILRLGMRY